MLGPLPEIVIMSHSAVVEALSQKMRNDLMFGMAAALLLNFEEIAWVEYDGITRCWRIFFDDPVDAVMFRLRYS
jgi:hypothetical protein